MSFTVAIVDDQAMSLLNTFSLLARDTQVIIDRDWCFNTPEALIAWLRQAPLRPDVVLLDVAYGNTVDTIQWLREQILGIKQLRPNTMLICMADYANDHLIRTAINAKADGFVVRSDISYGVPALIARTSERRFICSPSVQTTVQRHLPRLNETRCIPYWQLYNKLTPTEQTVAEFLFIQGLTAATVSQLTQLGQPSVHTYKRRVRKKIVDAIEEGYYDLPRADLLERKTKLSDEDVFHILTRLPHLTVH